MRWKSLTVRAAAVAATAAFIAGVVPPDTAAANQDPPSVASQSSGATYTNPISEGVVDTFPDPTMIRGKDGAWYAYGTTNPIFNSDGEEGERILPMMRSTDMVTWEYVGDVYEKDGDRPDYWSQGTRPWAPDIRYVNGQYTLTYSLSNGGVALLTAPTPTGPWEDHGLLVTGKGVEGCPTGNIDQALFTDTDGTHYFYWGSYDMLCVSAMNEDATALTGDVTQIAQGRRMEGALVVKHDDMYYLMYSDAGCCDGSFSGYTVKAGRSESPRGPFVDDDGVDLMSKSSNAGFVLSANGNGFTGTGHNTIQTDLAGQDWLVYHAIETADPDFPPVGNLKLSKRPLMIDRLDWIDGWPVVRAGAGPSNGEETAPVTTPIVGSDFADGSLRSWKTRGRGSVDIATDDDAGKHLRITAEGTGSSAMSGAATVTSQKKASGDLRVQTDIRFTAADADASAGAAGLVLGSNGRNGTTAWVDAESNELRIEIVHGSAVVTESASLPEAFDASTWHVVSVEWRGNTVTAEVANDGLAEPLAVVTATAPKQASSKGSVGFAASNAVVDGDNISAATLYTPVTQRVADPAPGKLLSEYSDDFDADGNPADNDDAWSWVRGQAKGSGVSDGSLVWPTNGDELFRETNTASVLLRDAPRNDYMVETKVTFDPTKAAQQAGLVLYEHDDSYLKLTHTALPVNRMGYVEHVTEFGKEGSRPTTTPPTAVANAPMFGAAPAETTWLRLYVQRDDEGEEYDVRMASSTDGENWQWGGVWSLSTLGDLRIGLLAMNAQGADATFDYLHTYDMKGEASQHPASWPLPMPYGTADDRAEITPGPDNSMVLDLETRPQDAEQGRVWMRDTYVNHFEVDGETLYVATGTTKVASLDKAGPWNDGIYMWTAPAMDGPWTLVDTTSLRPDQTKGKVWSPEFVDENTDERVVVADWQTYKHPDDPAKRAGNVWAPEVQFIDGTWYIMATMGDPSKLTGTFMLASEGGIEGPYRNIEGSIEHPLGDPVRASNPQYYHIDGGLFHEGDDTYLVLHNDLYSKMTPDMENLEHPTNLPKFDQQPFSPEPYLEGATVTKVGDKYYLMHAAWANKTGDGEDAVCSYIPDSGKKWQYDAIVAVSDSFEGPYSKRYTAGVGAGHNNMFVDEDGTAWMTFFRNPAHGYWADPDRVDDSAVAGVVRLEHAGPFGDLLYVERPQS
ncbi:family 43 glycosylhydrolase [Microbacterium sp. MPKO10]|uniref:family 43 glycosylhydrolase n=1 Tax=Microbacterium sp. MPKO10 TaxID=2989818 RepID=UPI00223606A2|nr:family 43 glycosylhydrolase [Microbacterium sp. MPKO10]MCW4460057.1 family 43 glycosylhydrolase [Microbacterium sp. MPKO10]